jgi:DDE superfamily endonuclease
MPTMVDFPTVVKAALDVFGDLFANEPEGRHFAEYLTGLMMADKKTVSGINRACAVTTDQSCLNRWLNEVAWDVTALNDRRLAWLQEEPKTRYSARGVIAIENTLVDHAGKLSEDVGWCWDHANERDVIAHDSLSSHYVCPSGAH